MSTKTSSLTEQQTKAINTRDVSIALSAGAGCGKTFVLTERFLSHLGPSHPEASSIASVDHLVALTFTDRAAREMRDRIRAKCYQRLEEARGEEAKYWSILLRNLESVRVSTIHSFCSSLLRSHAVEAGLDPQFAVLEQAQAVTLAAETIDDHLREVLAASNEEALKLVSLFGLQRLKDHLINLLAIRDESQQQCWMKTTPQQQVALWESFHREQVVPQLVAQVAGAPETQAVIGILRASSVSHPNMTERKSTLIELLPNLVSSETPGDQLQRIREAAMVQGAGGKKAWESDETYDEYKQAAKDLRAQIDKVKDLIQFDPAAALPAAEMGLSLYRLGAQIAESHDQRKRESGVLDFVDLLGLARKLLTAPDQEPLRRRLSSQIKLLLVDEFQDTDPSQVELVEALCGDQLASGKLFFVGDFKQSIYRFRGADPHVFRSLQETTPEAGRLPLTLNFRSQPAILEFVNAMFCEPFGEAYEPLSASREQVSPRPAIEFLWAVDEGSIREKGATERLRRREADQIARRICQILEQGEPLVWDTETEEPTARAAKPGDVAILFRALTDVQYYEEALRRYKIDYYLVGGHAFYAQQEIFDLLNLLRTMDSPADEIALAGVLRSPFFSLTDESLFWLAKHEDGLAGGLFADEMPDHLDEEACQRVGFAARTLRELRSRKDRLPVAQLINLALALTGYDAVLLAEFLGERKLANLRKLVEQARSFDRAGVFGLSDFILQLSQFIAKQPHEPLAATHSESTDVVRLMTIHQAKGLEFPIVVVPDLGRPSREHGGGLQFSPELGPLVKLDSKQPCSGYDLQQVINRQEDRNESVRLLYVACTRAADYLILSSSTKDLDKPQGEWLKLLANRFDLDSGKLVKALPEGYETPQVRITRDVSDLETQPAGKSHGDPLGKVLANAIELARESKGVVPESTTRISANPAARRRFSFSRLSGLMQGHADLTVDNNAIPGPPAIGALDPLAFGSLIHEMMETIPFGQSYDLASLAQRAASSHFDQPEAAIQASTEMVQRFLDSQRAADLAQAQQVHRELEFLLAWPPGEAREGRKYLEGFIDCLYQDQQGLWHVLDYKTNQVNEQSLSKTAAQYELQLYVYALAAEKVLDQPPQSLILHFLRPGMEVVYDWNDRARSQVESQVTAAIQESLYQR